MLYMKNARLLYFMTNLLATIIFTNGDCANCFYW